MFEIIFFALPAILSVYIYKSLTRNKYTNFDLLAIWSGFVLFINLVILSSACLHDIFTFPFISAQTTGIVVLKLLLGSIWVAVTIPILVYYFKYKTEIVKECRGELNAITARPEWCLSQLAKAIGFIVLLSWIFLSLTMRFFGDDELVFSKASVGIDFLVSRYNTWSSRLAIESLLVPLSKNFNIFKMFNILILCTLPIGFWLLFRRLNYAVWTFVLAVSLYNLSEMSSSGWAATLSNYYYAAWACVFATYLQTKDKLSIAAYIVLIILMIYGCSAEQCAIAMVIISTGVFWRNRNKAALLSIGIAAISLFMFLNAPGNGVRLDRAIQRFPDFVSYTVAYKAYLGYISTLSYYLFQENYFMIFFIGIIVLCKTNRLSL